VQPFVADVRAVVLGQFSSQLVYDPATRMVTFGRTPSSSMPAAPQADVFSVLPPTTIPVTIHFWLTLPKTTAGASGAPIVIVQHGITSWRGDVFSLGEDLARGGSAGVGFDLDFHGARTRCSHDAQCLGGAAGSCDGTSGVCAGGFVPKSTADDPFACVLAAFSGDMATDCAPAASGNGVLDPANLFGGRAGGFQYVVDAAQLIRVLAARGDGSLAQRLTDAGLAGALDPTRLSFLGQSLGAIDGTLLLATDPAIGGASVLTVAGGHLFEILSDGAFKSAIDQMLASLQITRGSPEYFQLVQLARWALDPVDPWSVARFIQRAPSLSYLTRARNPPKLAIVEEAGRDAVVPPVYQAALSAELWWPLGVDGAGHAQGRGSDGVFVSTFFADATHVTLLTASPSPSLRVQAVTYVLTDAAKLLPAAP
jgi:hypothetical protein